MLVFSGFLYSSRQPNLLRCAWCATCAAAPLAMVPWHPCHRNPPSGIHKRCFCGCVCVPPTRPALSSSFLLSVSRPYTSVLATVMSRPSPSPSLHPIRNTARTATRHLYMSAWICSEQRSASLTRMGPPAPPYSFRVFFSVRGCCHRAAALVCCGFPTRV